MEICLRMALEEAGEGLSTGAAPAECAAELIFRTAMALNLQKEQHDGHN
jgi:hypothetical protein